MSDFVGGFQIVQVFNLRIGLHASLLGNGTNVSLELAVVFLERLDGRPLVHEANRVWSGDETVTDGALGLGSVPKAHQFVLFGLNSLHESRRVRPGKPTDYSYSHSLSLTNLVHRMFIEPPRSRDFT